MARTRIDPWQSEEDLTWRPLSQSSLINSGSKPHLKPKLHSIQNDLDMVYQRRKQPETVLKVYARSLPTCTSPPWAYKPKPKPRPLSRITPNYSSSGSSDFEAAASKVLAALNMSGAGFNESSKSHMNTQRSSLELPNGDKRKNMIPTVVLRDIGAIISKVCPKLVHSPNKEQSTSQSQEDLETSCYQASRQTSPSPPAWDADQDDVPLAIRLDPKVLTVPDPPAPPLFGLSVVSLHPPVVTLDPPVVTLDPPVVTLDPPLLTIEPPVVTTPKVPDVVIRKSLVSKLPTMPTLSITEGLNEAFVKKSAISNSKKSLSVSEKSTTPVAIKSALFSASSKTPATTPNMLKSSPSYVACYPTETAGSSCTSVPLRKKSGVQISSASESPGLVETRLVTRSSSATISNLVKPNRFVKNGFPGFPEEDPKRLKKTRFHVNTNILASSLDLLDLHKHAGMPSGSPSNCLHCNVIFSSVKHCKFHQSVSSSEISSDPSRQQNVKEDGVWLCPWCPVMCVSIEYLQAHKQECREKGRCHQVQKDSSFRKNTNFSRHRNSIVSTNASTPSYKAMHGHVIPV